MCGIAGGNIRREVIERMSQDLRHRGPDHQGFYSDEQVTLAHNRLSIIDLSPAANQPMEQDDLIVIYNGEIYNFLELRAELVARGCSFSTQSDTEVLLRSYQVFGKECVQKFNGDFAFCIYDKSQKELFCARDRLGNKPFYYHIQDGNFVFASELFAFKNYLPMNFNEQKLGDALLFSINDNDADTIYQGIKNLEPAHSLEFDLGTKSLKVSRYWSLPENDSSEAFDTAQFHNKLDEYEELFNRAVQLRLISDVAVGASLSGGLDSSIMSCFIQRQAPQTTFYNVGYETHKAFDERSYVRLLDEKLHLKIEYLFPESHELERDFSGLLRAQCDLFRSLSSYPEYYVYKKSSEDVKVMLSGEGADELFGGYYHHIARFVASDEKNYRDRVKLFGQKQADAEFIAGKKFLLPDHEKLKLFVEDNAVMLGEIRKYLPNYQPNYQLLLKKYTSDMRMALRQDTIFLNLPQLLRYEDRSAMHFSVENRTPYTDYKLVEFVHSLPLCYKFRTGMSKYFLREFSKKYLPDEIANRKGKMGYEAPDSEWMQHLKMAGEFGLVSLRLEIYQRLRKLLSGEL